MMGEPFKVVVPLSVPVRHGDEVLTEIELVEPTVEDLQSLDGIEGNVEITIRTLCACTGLPPSVIKQIRLRDMRRLAEEVAKFAGEDVEDGGSPLPGLRTIFTGRRPS
jgi:hypothetical protein